MPLAIPSQNALNQASPDEIQKLLHRIWATHTVEVEWFDLNARERCREWSIKVPKGQDPRLVLQQTKFEDSGSEDSEPDPPKKAAPQKAAPKKAEAPKKADAPKKAASPKKEAPKKEPTHASLKDEARKLGIKGFSTKSKEDLAVAIRDHKAAASEDPKPDPEPEPEQGGEDPEDEEEPEPDAEPEQGAEPDEDEPEEDEEEEEAQECDFA